ncbi:lmbr1-like conserved region family protein, putative, partial [Ichthyophthirius multifiliis]
MPFIQFFKYLARKPDMPENEVKQSNINRLKLWIPNTIILNDNNLPPMWFYSSPDGYVYRTDQLNPKNVVAKLSNYSSPDELVALIKKLQYKDQSNICGNTIKLVSSKELLNATASQFQLSETTVIQKFIKSNGPKAFICRTVWRKGRNPYSWIITNKCDFYSEEKIPEYQKYITNVNVMNSCTIVHTCKGKYVDETIPYIHNILRYLYLTLHINFQEFVCDFIKDESGIWWMVNVKAFIFDHPIPDEINTKVILNYGDEIAIEQQENIHKQNKSKYQKVKQCKYCETILPEIELTQKMTLKMIIQTDKHLMHRNKNFQWLQRSDIKHIDTPLLYQEHKVCHPCYKLYTETEKLIQYEYNFAKILGIPCNEETKYNLVSLDQAEQAYGGNLTAYLYCEQNKIGTLKLSLKDFLSDKVLKREYYKVFDGPALPTLKWGLNLTIGMFNSGLVDVKNIKLQEKDGIYLPCPDYYASEPLPLEWIQLINEKKDYIAPLRLQTIQKNSDKSNQGTPRKNSHSISKLQKPSQFLQQQQQTSSLKYQSGQQCFPQNFATTTQSQFYTLGYSTENFNNTNNQNAQQKQSQIISELSAFKKGVQFADWNDAQYNIEDNVQQNTNQHLYSGDYKSENTCEDTKVLEELVKKEIKSYTEENKR